MSRSPFVHVFAFALILAPVLTACDPPAEQDVELAFDLSSIEQPKIGTIPGVWQNVPARVAISVRNAGARPARARLAYVAVNDPQRSVRLGAAFMVPAGGAASASMFLDVRPEWTRDGLFPFRLFVAKADHRDDADYDAALYRDANPADHVVEARPGLPVRTLYSRARVTVLRVRASRAGRLSFTSNIYKRSGRGAAPEPLGDLNWPSGGATVDLEADTWVPVDSALEVDIGGPLLGEGARAWSLGWLANAQFDDVVTIGIGSFEFQAAVWSRCELSGGCPFGPEEVS